MKRRFGRKCQIKGKIQLFPVSHLFLMFCCLLIRGDAKAKSAVSSPSATSHRAVKSDVMLVRISNPGWKT